MIHREKNQRQLNSTIRYDTIRYTILSLFSLQAGRTRSSSHCHPSSTIRIFLITSHQPLFHICITLPVESAPFFNRQPHSVHCPRSWFTSSCAYHLITVTKFALITYHRLYISLQT